MRQAEIDDLTWACSSFTLVHSGPSACTTRPTETGHRVTRTEAKVRSEQIAFPFSSFCFEKLDIAGFGAELRPQAAVRYFRYWLAYSADLKHMKIRCGSRASD